MTSTRSIYSFINKYNTKVAIIFSDKLIDKKNIDDKYLLSLPFWFGVPELTY